MKNIGETGRDDPPEQEPEKEQTPEAILDALESAFERGTRAELTVSEPSGELRTNAVFIEGLKDGVLFVSASRTSEVMPIEIRNVKKVSG